MRKRWILYLVLSLLVGRAWGLHLPTTLVQDAPCHGQAVHALHVAAQDQGDERAAPGDAMQGDGHVCCLILVDAQDWRWPVGLLPVPDRSAPRWVSASRDLDLRPPIQEL